MSSPYVHYKKSNEFERYHYLTSKEKTDINDIVSSFIQELMTTKGSNAFQRDFGTNFKKEITDIANADKVIYFIEMESAKIVNKYGITKILVKEVKHNLKSTTLDISIDVIVGDIAVSAMFDYFFNGNYISSDLLEI